MGACCSDERQHKDEMREQLDRRSASGIPTTQPENVMAEPGSRLYSSRTKQGYTSVEQATKGKGSQPADVKLFDEALAKSDVVAMVDLLESKTKIEKMKDKLHPWATNPTSVGALAATQLAVLASQNMGDLKNRIRQAGGIPKLVSLLRSPDEDRVHAAAIALSHLSEDCEPNAREMKSKDVMQLMIPHLSSPTEGMRYTAAATLRNMYILEVDWRKELVAQGGVEPMMKLLEYSPSRLASGKFDQHYEALLNIEDLLIDSNSDRVVQEVARAMGKANAFPIIKNLLKVKDEGIQEVGNEMLERLQSYVPASQQE